MLRNRQRVDRHTAQPWVAAQGWQLHGKRSSAQCSCRAASYVHAHPNTPGHTKQPQAFTGLNRTCFACCAVGTSTLPKLFACSLIVTLVVTPAVTAYINSKGHAQGRQVLTGSSSCSAAGSPMLRLAPRSCVLCVILQGVQWACLSSLARGISWRAKAAASGQICEGVDDLDGAGGCCLCCSQRCRTTAVLSCLGPCPAR
jgi:hypothetical protein